MFQSRRSRRLQQKRPTEKKEEPQATSGPSVPTSSKIRPATKKLASLTSDSSALNKRGILRNYKKGMQDSGHKVVNAKKPIVALLRRSTRLKNLAGESIKFLSVEKRAFCM